VGGVSAKYKFSWTEGTILLGKYLPFRWIQPIGEDLLLSFLLLWF